MSAGDFSQNAFSNELAFRVEFNGKVPENKDLYWRSKVFDVESKFTWKKGDTSFLHKKLNQDESDKAQLTQYKIVHQTTSDIKLPILETLHSSSKGRLMNDYTVLNRQRGTSAFEYEAISSLSTIHHESTSENLHRYLHLHYFTFDE